MKQSIQQLTKKVQQLLKRQDEHIQELKELSKQVDILEAEHVHSNITNSLKSTSHE